MKDEDRLMQTLQTIGNDAVVISGLLNKYETDAELMSVIGAVVSTWCDTHGVSLDDKVAMMTKLTNLMRIQG